MRHLCCLILMAGFFFPVLSAPAGARENRQFLFGWRFKQGDARGAERPDYDAADWQPVSLPHNWGWEHPGSGSVPSIVVFLALSFPFSRKEFL